MKIEVCVPDDAPPEYSEFWRLWQQEEYFACHEVLEELWRRENDERKQFYHGLIHCAVALHHARNGNAVGAANQWKKAENKLLPFTPEYSGVRVHELLREVKVEAERLLPGLKLERE